MKKHSTPAVRLAALCMVALLGIGCFTTACQAVQVEAPPLDGSASAEPAAYARLQNKLNFPVGSILNAASDYDFDGEPADLTGSGQKQDRLYFFTIQECSGALIRQTYVMETQLDNCRGQIDTLAVKRSTSGFSGASSKVADFDGDGADEVLLAIFYQTIDGTNEPMELRVMKYSDGKFIDTLVVACNSTDIASTFFPENEAGLSVSNIAWEDSVIWVSTEELNGMPVICLLHSDGGEFAGYSYLGCIDGIWQLVKQEKWSPSSQLA